MDIGMKIAVLSWECSRCAAQQRSSIHAKWRNEMKLNTKRGTLS